MFAAAKDAALDDPQDIVDEIHALATGENQKFRTLVGHAGKDLMALRNRLPIEDYLAKIAANFALAAKLDSGLTEQPLSFCLD